MSIELVYWVDGVSFFGLGVICQRIVPVVGKERGDTGSISLRIVIRKLGYR